MIVTCNTTPRHVVFAFFSRNESYDICDMDKGPSPLASCLAATRWGGPTDAFRRLRNDSQYQAGRPDCEIRSYVQLAPSVNRRRRGFWVCQYGIRSRQSGDELRRDIAAIQNRLDALENGALGVHPCAAEDLCSGPCEPTCGGGCPPDCGDMASDCAGYGACGGCGCLPLVGYDDGFFAVGATETSCSSSTAPSRPTTLAIGAIPPRLARMISRGDSRFTASALVPNGTLFTPALNYFAVILPTNSGGNDHIEECKMYYEFANGSLIQFGRFRDPSFMRELDIAFTNQLGMERSYVHSIFSTGILEGVASTSKRSRSVDSSSCTTAVAPGGPARASISPPTRRTSRCRRRSTGSCSANGLSMATSRHGPTSRGRCSWGPATYGRKARRATMILRTISTTCRRGPLT